MDWLRLLQSAGIALLILSCCGGFIGLLHLSTHLFGGWGVLGFVGLCFFIILTICAYNTSAWRNQ